MELLSGRQPRHSEIARRDQVARLAKGDAMFNKLYTIAAAVLIAAVAASASAAGHIARLHHARAQLACPQTVVIPPGRGYGVCGGKFWVRDPQSGETTTMPAFWRHLRLDRPDDHP
jgi:hypothetical protein